MSDLPVLDPEPSWLQSKVDQRVAFMLDTMGGALNIKRAGYELVVTMLREAPPHLSSTERLAFDHSCDGCGRYLPKDLQPGHVERTKDGVLFDIVFGVCRDCVVLP